MCCRQSAGELVEKNGKFFKRFYGMSSAVAMQKYAGGVAEYRASEGKCVEVPFRGDVDGTITDILGGVRSTCTCVVGRVHGVWRCAWRACVRARRVRAWRARAGVLILPPPLVLLLS